MEKQNIKKYLFKNSEKIYSFQEKPTNFEVLWCYLNIQDNYKCNNKETLRKVHKELMKVWKSEDVKSTTNIKNQIKKLVENYKKLQKNFSRKNIKEKVKIFKRNLKFEFDIYTRKSRFVDNTPKLNSLKRKRTSNSEVLSSSRSNTISSYTESRESCSDYEINSRYRKKIKIDESNIYSLVDRANLSCRKFALIENAIFTENQTSKSSIFRNLQKNRDQQYALKKEYLIDLGSRIELHWDGAKLDKQSFLVIIASGNNFDTIIGIKPMEKSTGKAMADKVIEVCKKFDLTSKIRSLCFDTTNSNSGELFTFSIYIKCS